MEIKSYIVNAFTDEIFRGNQAAVCLLEKDISEENMLLIAKEFGFSETAFIVPIKNDNFAIRYFSPKMEIPLCGHATLASAKVLFSEYKDKERFSFQTYTGDILEIIKKNQNIEMYFPVHTTEKASISVELKNAIGLDKIVNCEYNKEHNILMVEVTSSEEIEKLHPDFNELKNIKTSLNGILITALSSNKSYDFEYRYFWPWSGSNEDPVTGGVQSFLTRYWSHKLNKTTLQAYQSSERTGSMEVRLMGDKTIIKSNAVIFFKGEIYL